MKLGRRFGLPAWDERAASIAVDYLSSRGFRDAKLLLGSAGIVILGSRGSWLEQCFHGVESA